MNMLKNTSRLIAGLLAFSLSGASTAWADGGLMGELRNKALYGQPPASDRRHENRDHQGGSYEDPRRRPDNRQRDYRAGDDDRYRDRYRNAYRPERRDYAPRRDERYVKRYYDHYVTGNRYHGHGDDGKELVLGLLLGGLFGYAVGNAQPVYGYDYGR